MILTEPASKSYAATALRWGLLIAAIVAINYAVSRGLTRPAETLLDEGLSQDRLIALAALAFYALLLAIPFVPGAEIGLSLLIMNGPAVALHVYVATVIGLTLSYVVGRALGTTLPCGFLRTMGLVRACAFVDRMKTLNYRQRRELLEASAPSWVGKWLLRHRYILLALLINTPGNSIIGGGGGIALLAGLSGMFSGLGFVLTVAVATSPVPLAVTLFGTDFLARLVGAAMN